LNFLILKLIVGYHVYPGYYGERIDYDYGATWLPFGGSTLGKAQFLRSIMGDYGVEKPFFLNETGLMCPDHDPYLQFCDPPVDAFYQAQADHLTRTFTRGQRDDTIMGFIWFTLENIWRNTGLLDPSGNERLVYYAYQQLALRLENSKFKKTVDYGDGIEAYEFQNGLNVIHVVWAREDGEDPPLTISVIQSNFVEAYSQYGDILPKDIEDEFYTIEVGFSPIYVVLNP